MKYSGVAVFCLRQTHSVLMKMPDPLVSWKRPFQRMAAEVQLQQRSIQEAEAALQQFLHPVLNGIKLACGSRFIGSGYNGNLTPLLFYLAALEMWVA